MQKTVDKHVNDVMEIIHSKDDLNEIVFSLHSFKELVDYKSVIKNGGDNLEKRKLLIASELKNISSKPLKEYFQSLIRANDMWIFEPGHFGDFEKSFKDLSEDVVLINLVAALEIKEKDLKKLTEDLSKKMEKKVVLDVTVDKTIIGGAIIKKDNFVLDFSLKNKLGQFGSEWKKSVVKSGNVDE
ncbi:TPA: hypothetical protein DDW69_00835 [candidate division CPR2 bacterium]|uniref:ATP synthase subunit delta n=1 Tax=candidate division CPR2 bacterium GW2011_GWC1_41_48 TaxID=1618344 RepID=A0A0G0W7C2_UNCC2|nr:MAG: ATP synthase subunit delta [candidate division CPR2 bacterium GW2011_GWC2_39_35]KKS08880.1 MAG: ATP synthase subunit delta [candidate division CPR2 bacterium GW2011_GWC1_41_48]OGB72177.1 MAG: hypothetical protein A2Y26_00685 [candidate division CPR2 bacterium GWD2_39_7]HBG81365.1 hypothetical protein [candidate division CPR2 bacterium]HCL99660.1 hypothetical protein [candidate division CPR2 bacterium]